jgi:hypothetical protein
VSYFCLHLFLQAFWFQQVLFLVWIILIYFIILFHVHVYFHRFFFDFIFARLEFSVWISEVSSRDQQSTWWSKQWFNISILDGLPVSTVKILAAQHNTDLWVENNKWYFLNGNCTLHNVGKVICVHHLEILQKAVVKCWSLPQNIKKIRTFIQTLEILTPWKQAN